MYRKVAALMAQDFKDKDSLSQAVSALQHDMGEVIHSMDTNQIKTGDEVSRLYDKIESVNSAVSDIKLDVDKRQKVLEDKINKLESDLSDELDENNSKITSLQKDIGDSNKQLLFLAVSAILSYLFTHFA
ncbi:orf119* [Lactobacillus phage LP65]|uniref:Orf119 n=1 Tax=Lactobacillus phage LP65 TaxID=2892344 RepID=Q5ULJ5_9CAUD|nr:hypothetical protein LP65_gp119 [Lactobacillus phage LP65]AAV35939.1 orf119* [Lactobacillus phage LP65]